MGTRRGSHGRPPENRTRDSVPVLVVRLGPARDLLIALAVLGFTLVGAMVIAFVLFG